MIWGSPIKVLKNSVLRWRIANENDNVHILSVNFVGNGLGCIVNPNPSCDYEYILTTSTALGNVQVEIIYRQGVAQFTASNTHTNTSNYDFYGYISYNNTGNMNYYNIAPFIGRVILWGKT